METPTYKNHPYSPQMQEVTTIFTLSSILPRFLMQEITSILILSFL